MQKSAITKMILAWEQKEQSTSVAAKVQAQKAMNW